MTARQSRNTKQRELVLEAVKTRRDHPSADDIYLALRKKSPDISRGTVYRNLRLLSKIGELRQVEMPDKDRFDWRQAPHYHLRCTSCGTLSDAALPYNPALDSTLEKTSGYHISHHSTVFEGLCPQCQSSLKQAKD